MFLKIHPACKNGGKTHLYDRSYHLGDRSDYLGESIRDATKESSLRLVTSRMGAVMRLV